MGIFLEVGYLVYILPVLGLALLEITIVGIIIRKRILQDWLQTKMHPQYEQDVRSIMVFFWETLSKLKQAINQQKS